MVSYFILFYFILFLIQVGYSSKNRANIRRSPTSSR